MTEDVLRECRTLFELMRRFWAAFGHQMGGVLARSGINVPQYMAMVALADLDGATMGDLAKRLRVTMGASTNVVDKLVRGGYVSRRRSASDRRVVNVALREKGRKVLREVQEKAVDFVARALAVEAPEVRRKFLENYEKIVTIAEDTVAALADKQVEGAAG